MTTSNIERFGENLRSCLERNGVAGGLIFTITAAPHAIQHGVKTKEVEAVCQLILKRYRQGSFCLTAAELDRVAPEVTCAIELLSVLVSPGLKEVCLDLTPTFGGAVPLDERWIMNAIDSKLKKYGGAEAVKDLTLVIGAPMFVDQRQIESFRAAHPNQAALPFLEIWLSTWQGPTCLKARIPH